MLTTAALRTHIKFNNLQFGIKQAPTLGMGPAFPPTLKGVACVHNKNENGQAVVEFALVLPILLLLLCGIIDFGWIFGNQLLANNATREAARYTAIHYYDSNTDNDGVIAAGIVASRAPTLSSPSVETQASGDSITVTVTSQVSVLTPLLSPLFNNGECTVRSVCTMRLE